MARRRAVDVESVTDRAGAAPAGRVIHVTVHEGLVAKDELSIDLGAWAAILFARTEALVIEHPPRGGAAADVVEGSRRDLLNALDALRSLDDDRVRDLALGGIVGALTIGFHHRGGPEMVEQARADITREAKASITAKGRRKAAETVERQDAATERNELRPLVFAAWNNDLDLFRHRQWKDTACKIIDQFAREMSKHVQCESIWFLPLKHSTEAEAAYIQRMKNHIRALAAEYKAAHPAV